MTARRALLVLALAVAAAHLPFVASSLEDIDSVNFALGVRDFDVAAHRPHPPGYPVYIAAGKVMAAVVGAMPGRAGASTVEARSLSLLSLMAALCAVGLLYRVCATLRDRGIRQAEGGRAAPWGTLDVPALGATALAVTCPLIWSLAIRPMSDLPGLAIALAAQACLLTAWWWQTPAADGERRMVPATTAASGRMIVLGALLAGVAVGVRTQTLWLAAPLLVVVLVDRIGRGVAGALIGATMTFTIGALVWAVPLVVVSGGLNGYLAALGSQAGEDFVGGEMLWVNPAPRLVAQALVHTFVDPWESVPLGSVVLILAAAGALRLLWRDRRTLVVLAAMGGPYLVFHLLFQDTSFVRYAAPLVPVVAFLAVQGCRLVHPTAVPAGAAALSIWALALAGPIVQEYAAAPAPTVRAVDAMNAAAGEAPGTMVAMHQTFVRPLEAERVVLPQIPAPPRREWMELARFWSGQPDGRVWFLADPRRTDLALIDPRSRTDVTAIRWAPSSRRVHGGMRPAAVDWIRFSPPLWFAEEGWALTPETAGMARLMGRAPHLGPITAGVRREAGAMHALIGGRNLGAPGDPAAEVLLDIDGTTIAQWHADPGFFLHAIELPAGTLLGEGPLARLAIRAVPVAGETPVPVAIEQFDLQPAGTLMQAFDAGWHEAEYTPALGIWHWTSDRSTVRVLGATTAVRVTLEFEPPLRYFDGPSDVRAVAGTAEVSSAVLSTETTWSVEVPLEVLNASGGLITFETSQTFVPAERRGVPDRRVLGLRVFRVTVDPVGLR